MDPDQTAPIGAVCSGSTLFASILNLSVIRVGIKPGFYHKAQPGGFYGFYEGGFWGFYGFYVGFINLKVYHDSYKQLRLSSFSVLTVLV